MRGNLPPSFPLRLRRRPGRLQRAAAPRKGRRAKSRAAFRILNDYTFMAWTRPERQIALWKDDFLYPMTDRGAVHGTACAFIKANAVPPMKDQERKIFEEAFRVLRPRTPLPEFEVAFRPYADVSNVIRIRDGKLTVGLSDLL